MSQLGTDDTASWGKQSEFPQFGSIQKRRVLLSPFCSKLWKDIVNMTLKIVFIFTKALKEMFICEDKQENILIHT